MSDDRQNTICGSRSWANYISKDNLEILKISFIEVNFNFI